MSTPWRQRFLSTLGGVLVLASMAWVLAYPDIPSWAKVFDVVIGLSLLIDAVLMWRGERRLYARATEWLNRHISR